MNKKLKIATAAVSVVMAGTMVFGIVGCTPGDKGNNDSNTYKPTYTVEATDRNVASVTDAEKVETKEVASGLSLYVKKGTKIPAYTNDAYLSMNVCDGSNQDRHITYHSSQIATSAVMPDGKTYRPGDLKPAWAEMSANLGLRFADSAQNRGSDDQIKEMISKNEQAQYNIVTGSGAQITTNSTHFLNLNQFLEYMPNYKAFLDENPIVKWSLTSNTSTGAMYYAPYFDGNNDIEKYVLTHREWTRVMLDNDLPTGNLPDTDMAYYISWNASKGVASTNKEENTRKEGVGDELTYAVGEMGKVEADNYKVETVNPADPNGDLIKLVVNYGKALDDAKVETTALGAAYKTAAGAVYAGTSGNIVDIMNAAITATNGEVTGDKLLNIVRAYIDTAYQTEAGAKFYTTRSDVFNSVSAGWDIDLYTALSRCVVTSYRLFGATTAGLQVNQIYAVAGRQGTSQRRLDVVRFVGELYGVRGMESRNEYTYVDANGALQDARLNADTYDALNKFSALTKEGLVYTGEATVAKYASGTSSILTFSMHDYSQTQTTDGFYLDVEKFNGKDVPNGLITKGDLKFDFAPIVTPVAKWDANSDGTKETYMRFTESWRAVKNTGFAVPVASVRNNPEKLSAVLAFIDYLFSNDGQIVGTYGSMSTNGNVAAANGFWYGTDGVDILDANGAVKSAYTDVVGTHDGVQYYVKDAYKGTYFAYGNKLYKGTDYLGTQVPTLTTNNMTYYYGKEVNGHKMGEGSGTGSTGYIGNQAGNYTNYCRGIVGGALPIGNKSQGFEYQATAQCGLDGSKVVSDAIVKGAIKHLTQEVTAATYWYTCVPTTLPISSADSSIIKAQSTIDGASSTAGLFRDSSNTTFRSNLPLDLMFLGYSASITDGIAGNKNFGTTIPADSAACLKLVKDNGLETRLEIYQQGWNSLKTAYMK